MATTKKSAKTTKATKSPTKRATQKAIAKTAAPLDLTAASFTQRLYAHQSDAERKKIQRYFKTGAGDYGAGDTFMGVRMGQVFALAKEFIALPPAEISRLLDSEVHEVRAGALSIMDKQARDKQTPPARHQELYALYFQRMDRINNWDLVDLAAPFVVGGYLADKSRAPLYQLARSRNLWERRTAVLASYYFLRHGETADAFKLAELLLHDDQDLMHKCVGAGLRWAGDSAPAELRRFLDRHAATMPRVMLRFALEHFQPAERAHYLGLKDAPA
jgi:3-methyladenine DNA glycosylase AlkD